MINELESQIRRDMHYLAGTLPHRGAYTDNERSAAEYLRERFLEHTPDVAVEGFTSIESYYYFFASYYGEFLFVALIAVWWPQLAFVYGVTILLMYLAEFTSYRAAARILPQYESQNVVARFPANRPSRLIVVAANYDSPKEGVLSTPAFQSNLRHLHLALVVCMVTVILSCAAEAFHPEPGEGFQAYLALRWSAVACLMCAAVVYYYHEASGEFSSGAVDNATGVAALLAVAGRLEKGPLPDDTEVWLLATGAKDAWMSGIYDFVRSHNLDRDTTYFLHLDKVGAGELRYVTGEGLLHLYPCSPEMVSAARRVADGYEAAATRDRGAPSDALVTLTRGFHTLRITGTEADQRAASRLPAPPDGLARVSYAVVARAANFAEATVRGIAAVPVPRAAVDSALPGR